MATINGLQQWKRDTAANLASANPTLLVGEPAFETDTYRVKIGDGSTVYNSLPYQGNIVGEIKQFAASTTPTGYLYCDGTAVSRTTYANLFSVVGTTWGVGDGSTTFNLPDFRGAFLRGTGSHGTETMADGNPFAGPALGAYEDDQIQDHAPDLSGSGGAAGTTFPVIDGNSPGRPYNGAFQGWIANGQGTPRTGDETRPFACGIRYLIKY